MNASGTVGRRQLGHDRPAGEERARLVDGAQVVDLADLELVTSARCRWILFEDKPTLIGYDQDLWVDRLLAPPAPTQVDEDFEDMSSFDDVVTDH